MGELSYSTCDRQQHKTHRYGHQKNHRFSCPGAKKRPDFANPCRDVNSTAERNQAQGQSVKCEADEKGEYVGLQCLNPNQGMNELSWGLWVVHRPGLVIFMD